MKSQYKDVQSIYDDDHSPDLLELFLDRTMTYSCAYFERDDMTLEEAQIAKLDLSLAKCNLKPGQTLLDVGCGYGECAYRAAEKYGVNVIAVTPSVEQAKIATEKMKSLPAGSGSVEVLNQGWEECHMPVDRIISIGALEHFGLKNYQPFFARCMELLSGAGRMLLHSIVSYSKENLDKRGIKVTHENVLFHKFIQRQIFPGGNLNDPDLIADYLAAAGFIVERKHLLGLHYARTLDSWAENLARNRDKAIARKSLEVFERYMKYLTGCADHFRSGHIDLCQFTLRVA